MMWLVMAACDGHRKCRPASWSGGLDLEFFTRQVQFFGVQPRPGLGQSPYVRERVPVYVCMLARRSVTEWAAARASGSAVCV